MEKIRRKDLILKLRILRDYTLNKIKGTGRAILLWWEAKTKPLVTFLQRYFVLVPVLQDFPRRWKGLPEGKKVKKKTY